MKTQRLLTGALALVLLLLSLRATAQNIGVTAVSSLHRMLLAIMEALGCP